MPLRILLADDHPVVRATLRQILEREPQTCVVAEASDGVGAVEMTLKLSPDIVLMDTSMPSMNGIEATRQLMASNARTRVIALSLHMDAHLIAEAFDAGARGYLLKETAASELISAIRDVVAGRLAMSVNILEMLNTQIRQALAAGVLKASVARQPAMALNRSCQ